jgi:hypothetical protein
MPNIDGQLVPLLFWRYTDGCGQYEWGKECDTSYQISALIDATVQEAGAKGMTVVVQVFLEFTEKLYPPKPDEPAETSTQEESEK